MTRKPLIMAGLAAAIIMSAGGAYATDDEGIFVFLDAAFSTPGNTDQVVAQVIDAANSPQTTTDIMPEWGSSPVGRIGVGYAWDSGSSVAVSYWQFDDDETVAAEGPVGGFMNFGIGPAVYYGGYAYFNFGLPGSTAFTAELEASTIDVTFAREVEVGEYFNMDWHVGVRFASFEETLTGAYDICASGGCDYTSYEPGDITFDASKATEGDMFGFKAGARGRYFITGSTAVTSGLSLSMLQGKVTTTSGLTPDGLYNGIDPPSVVKVEDDSRSGMITDFDVGIEWYMLDDRLRLYLRYEYSVWNGIPEDLVKNPPGLLTRLQDRDTVSFSGAVLGARLQF